MNNIWRRKPNKVKRSEDKLAEWKSTNLKRTHEKDRFWDYWPSMCVKSLRCTVTLNMPRLGVCPTNTTWDNAVLVVEVAWLYLFWEVAWLGWIFHLRQEMIGRWLRQWRCSDGRLGRTARTGGGTQHGNSDSGQAAVTQWPCSALLDHLVWVWDVTQPRSSHTNRVQKMGPIN